MCLFEDIVKFCTEVARIAAAIVLRDGAVRSMAIGVARGCSGKFVSAPQHTKCTPRQNKSQV